MVFLLGNDGTLYMDRVGLARLPCTLRSNEGRAGSVGLLRVVADRSRSRIIALCTRRAARVVRISLIFCSNCTFVSADCKKERSTPTYCLPPSVVSLPCCSRRRNAVRTFGPHTNVDADPGDDTTAFTSDLGFPPLAPRQADGAVPTPETTPTGAGAGAGADAGVGNWADAVAGATGADVLGLIAEAGVNAGPAGC